MKKNQKGKIFKKLKKTISSSHFIIKIILFNQKLKGTIAIFIITIKKRMRKEEKIKTKNNSSNDKLSCKIKKTS